MAEDFSLSPDSSYQDTNTYRNASSQRRRQLNRYKKELGISDEHMFLLLFSEDLKVVPKEARTKGDTASRVMLIVAVLLFFNTTALATSSGGQDGFWLLILALVSFCLVAAVFYLGLLNPYKRVVRRTKKLLKDMPEVEDFTAWDLAHPDKSDRKAAKRKGKRR